MSEQNGYVTRDPSGVMRVGEAGVPLESVLAGFEQGHSPETIRTQYPALTLEEVYGAITYSLAHPEEVQQYLKAQDLLWDNWRDRLKQSQPGVVERLRAMRRRSAAMSRPRFLADQDLNEHIITGVLRRERSIEFLHLRDLGLSRQPDGEVLAAAAARGLLLVSHDVNTMINEALARIETSQPMSGLFMVQQRSPIAPVIDSLVLLWSGSEAEEWHGQVIFLPL